VTEKTSARIEERALELNRLLRRQARVQKEHHDLGDELLVFRRRFRPIGHPLDGRAHCHHDLGAVEELVDARTVSAGALEHRGEVVVRDHGRRDASRSHRVAAKAPQSPVERRQLLVSGVRGILKDESEEPLG
jgi:hypothetical protein